MNDHDFKFKTRLADVLNSILCPIAGCWPLHGAESDFYFDSDAESYVLEVWPVAVSEEEETEENGHEEADPCVLYELAEFDFTELMKQIPLEEFHFSQRRSIFEMCWKEDDQQLELRVHIVPREVADEI